MSTYEARLAALARAAEGRPAGRLRRAAHRRAYERICRQLCAAARLADRLPGLGRRRRGASGRSGDLRRRPLHAAGARPGRRQALELSVGARNQHRRLAEGPCAGRRPDRLRSLAAHQGMGDQGARGAGRERRRAGRGRAATRSTRSGPTGPSRRKARLVVHPDELCRQDPRPPSGRKWPTGCKEQKADAAVLSALDSIAWTFNVRGKDVDHTPVALSFALVHDDGTADLFVASEKLGDDVRQHLGNGVRIHEREAFAPELAALAGKTVVADPERAVAAIFEALEAGRREGGVRSATRRSCPRRSRTRPRLPAIAPRRPATAPRSAASSLAVDRGAEGRARRAQGRRRSSRSSARNAATFATSASTPSPAPGRNGAIVHYRVSEETNRPIEMDSLYLVDSGGQYPDGTTDVTRTVAIGTPTAEMRDRFTRVLKGHIALGSARLPGRHRGTPARRARAAVPVAGGARLRPRHRPRRRLLSRRPRGPAAHLAGREQPAGRRRAASRRDDLLERARLLQDRRIWHPRRKSGRWSCRSRSTGAEKKMLGFETLTFAPIDRSLIETALLTADERRWVDDYHARVLEVVGPQLDGGGSRLAEGELRGALREIRFRAKAALRDHCEAPRQAHRARADREAARARQRRARRPRSILFHRRCRSSRMPPPFGRLPPCPPM